MQQYTNVSKPNPSLSMESASFDQPLRPPKQRIGRRGNTYKPTEDVQRAKFIEKVMLDGLSIRMVQENSRPYLGCHDMWH